MVFKYTWKLKKNQNLNKFITKGKMGVSMFGESYCIFLL